ncbi:hypothetical protein [Polyangium sorediatum]|uniref:Lipoprotein n=1 Tax=Polyangium sorediatum TaxID=889274 RepID=A0ABT6P3Z6_9BACT|nr:hypothetical protein [Polyangium sorediatum]MDI1435256.1 hypothetical protein [Polyangium sorediatum]
MLRTSHERSRLVFFCCLLLGLSACTFPAIDYAEPDESGGEGPACAATPKCANDVESCAKQATGQRSMCVSQCEKGWPSGSSFGGDCSACETAHDTALNNCVAQCETCSASGGCTNALDSCRALLGFP